MKQKLLAVLKTEYAKSGLSDKAFDGVASVLVKTITKEDEIDGVIKSDETRNLVKAYQSTADTIRNEKAVLQAEFDKYKKEHPEIAHPEPEPDSEQDDVAKKLLERIEALEKENKESKAKAARAERLASVREKMKHNGSDSDFILDLVLERAEFKDEDSVDDIAAKLKSDYDSTFAKAYGNGGGIPRHHANITPDYNGDEDDDFVKSLREQGKLPKKDI